MNKPLLLLALILGIQASAIDAATVTLDFESLAHDDDLVSDVGHLYQEDGFVLENAGFFPFATYGAQAVDWDSSPVFTGSTALFNDNDDALTTLSLLSGGVFDLVSIDLAELFVATGVAYRVAFTGITAALGTVTQEFTLDGIFGAETFTFDPGFTNLTSVSWTNTADYHQFDNIQVSSVPEPQTLSLMLLGLGLMGTLARRKGTSV